jgi:phosphocarrier protein HPr
VIRIEAEVEIVNELGLHLRAAAAFARVAEAYRSDVSMLRDELRANGKSIISLVTLAAPKGTRIRLVAEGEDAEAAVQALRGLIENRFGEDS